MTLYEKVHLATKQFILNAKSPWRFFILWAFSSICGGVALVYVTLGLFWFDDLGLVLLGLVWILPFFGVWMDAIYLFYSPELRFWSIRRCLQKPEVSGLDLEKIKSKHIEYLDLLATDYFLTVVGILVIDVILVLALIILWLTQ